MKRGYSILEVLVAMTILAILLPGLVKWVTSSRQSQVGTLRSEQATELAQNVMDSLRDLPRSIRTPVANHAIIKNGVTYLLTWNYLTLQPNEYTGTRPGAASVDIRWTAGKADRVSHLDGVLP